MEHMTQLFKLKVEGKSKIKGLTLELSVTYLMIFSGDFQ